MRAFTFLTGVALLGVVLVGCGGPAGPVDPQAQRISQLMMQVRQAPPEDRKAAAEELGQLKAPAAVPALLAAMSDSQFAVRLAAMNSLGAIGDKAAVPALVTMLGDNSSQLRKAAVDALGAIGDPSALTPLLARLQDDEVVVRYSVAVALGKLGPTALTALLKTLQEGSPVERAGAVYALGGMRQDATTDAILAALGDPNLTVRRNAVDALGRAKNDRAVPVLAGLLAQPLTTADRTRYRAQSQEELTEKTLKEIGALLREREASRAIPTGGTYPHQADKRRAVLAAEIQRLAALVAPPFSDEKQAAIGVLVADRIGKEQFAALSREQRDLAVTKELMFLNDVVKPPDSSEKDEQLVQILARRAARDWWEKLETKGQEAEIRKELARRLEDQLKHEEVEMRQAAAGALAAIGSPVAIQSLVAALGGSDRLARADAQGALQTMGAAAIAPLTQVVITKEYPVEVRGRAMDLLTAAVENQGGGRHKDGPIVAAGKDELSTAMLAVLNAGAADAQLKAAEVLARLGTATPAVIAPLLQALKTGDLRLRCAAAKSLGLLRDKSTADALLAALQDQESAVRGAAAEALGQLGDKRAAQPVMEILRTALAADDKDLILATTRALGRLEVKESVELILPLVQRTGKDERDMAGTAATALGRIRDPRAVDALVGLMLTNLWGPCFDAARALGQIGDARAVESLESLVLRVNPRPFPEFPAVALEALGKIRDGKAVQALFNVLKAPDNATHKFAAEALIAQGETALPVLMQVLGEEDEKMRGLAAQILGYIGQPAIEALVTFTANPPHTGGLSAAIYALSSIRDQRVVEPLVGLLKHENAGIRANAAWALGFSNDKRALEALQVAAETDAEPKVRSAAASARERVQGDLANAAASTAQR